MNKSTQKLFAYYAALVGVGLIVGVLGPTLGALAAQTSSTLQQVSLILAMRPLGYLGGTLLSGRILERTPGHPVLAGAALAAAGFLALVPLAPALMVLAALILCMGFAQGVMDVGSNSLLTWVYHGRSGPYLSGLHFSFGVGAFAAPLLAALALRHGGPAWAYWGVSLYLLPVALIFSRVPSPSHADESNAPPAAPADGRLSALFLCLFFLYGGSESGFGIWIYQYSLHFNPGDVERAALLSSLFWGLLGLGRLGGIPVLARFTPKQFLAVLLPSAVACFTLAMAWPERASSLLWASAGAGLSMSCIFPTLQVFAGKRLAHGGRVSSRLTSFFFVGSSTGTMALPWLMGQLFEPIGPRAALSLPVLGAAGMLVLYGAILRRSR